MKKISLLLLVCVALLTTTHAQIPPNAFNYSAVARNAAGDPISTSTIGIQITILKTSPTGASQYMENHFVNTDAFGLFNLVIGAGAVQSGNMATIDWSNDNYYLKVGMDAAGGTNFLTMGTTQLLSVPYALYAKSAGSVSGGSGITIESVSPMGDTLFLSNGQTFVGGGSSSGGNLVLPNVTTNAVIGITSNSAHFGGVVSNANDNQIIERGIVYSTTPNPTIVSNKIAIGSGIGAFDTLIKPEFDTTFFNNHILNSNTLYHVRAYVINENNIISYGNEVNFTTLSTGQIGPAGGIVFFDKGNLEEGWQFLEVAPVDQGDGIEWGCDGTVFYGTSSSIGSGETNTAIIIANCNEAMFAARLCDDLNLGGQTDWFLPSLSELNLIYRNLYSSGNFNYMYWSSESRDSSRAWAYGGGTAISVVRFATYFAVRAVRAF